MKILIVDDNATDRKLLRVQLENAGHEIRETTDGKEALALLAREGFDALISDILMPNLDGYGLCIEIRKNKKLIHLPVILYSATYVTAADEKLARDAGADRYIRKPAQAQVLLDALTESIAKRKSLRRLSRTKKEPNDVMKEHSGRLIQKIADKNTELEQANRDLREREQRLNSIIENEPECIKILARDGSLVEMNPAGLAMVEADSLQEVQGKPIYSVIKEQYRAAFRALTESVFKGESGKLVFEIVGLKGTPRWLETQAVPMSDEQGQVTALLGITRDITEHKQAEQERLARDERYRHLVENASDETSILAADGSLLYESPSSNPTLGYAPGEFIHRNLFELIHPEDVERIRNQFARLVQDPSLRLRDEFRLRHRDGTWRWVEAVGTNLLAEPSVGGIVINYHDISERKTAQAFLQESLAQVTRGQQTLQTLSYAAQAAQRAHTAGDIYEAVSSEIQKLGFDLLFLEVNLQERNMRIGYLSFAKSLVRAAEKLTGLSLKTYRLPLIASGHFEQVLLSGKSILYSDTVELTAEALPPSLRPLAKQISGLLKMKRGIYAPVMAGEVPQGILAVLGNDLREADVAAVDILAAQLSISLQNARLYESVQVELAERKRTEELLRTNETSLQAILRSTADGILAVDAENKVLFANDVFTRIWSIPQDVLASGDDAILLNHVLDQLVDPQGFLKKVQDLYRSTEDSFDTLLFKDGRIFERLSRALMDGTQVRGRVWSFHDITERRRAEQDLQAGEERYRSLVDGMLDGVYRSTHAGRFLDVNPAMLRMFGYSSREEMLALDIKKDMYFAPGDRESLFLDTGHEKVDEFRMKRKDGSEIWVEDHGHYVHDRDGNVIYHEGTLRDITERKRAEHEIHQLSEFNANIINSANEGIALVDVEGIQRLINPAGAAMMGRSVQELTGLHWKEFIPVDQHAIVASADEMRIKGESNSYELELERPDGGRSTVLVSGSPRFENGKFAGTLAVFTDITDLKKIQSDILKHNQELSALNRAGRLLSQLATPDEILEIMYDVTSTVLDNRNFYIALHDPDRNLVSFPIYTINGERQPVLERAFGNGLTEHILHTHEPLLITHDMDAQIERLGISAIGSEARSFLGVPILAGNSALGVIAVQDYLAEGSYGTRELELLATLASQTAIALSNARLFTDEQAQRALAEALRATAETLNRTLNIGEVLDSILDNVGRVVTHDTASILLIEEGRVRVSRTRGHAERGLEIEKVINELSLSETNNLHRMITTGEPVVVPDTQSDPSWVPMPGAEFLRSNVGAPIFIEGQVVGFLFLDSLTPGFFTPLHAEHLMAFANQAAFAIQKARLYRQAQQEIAERGQMEEALRASETRFRALIENSADLILVIGAEGVIRFVSPSAERILGYTYKDAVGHNFFEWVHPDDIPIATEALQSRREISGTAQATIELRGLHKNGTWRMVEVLGTNLLTEPAVNGIVLNIRDITDRKQAEQEVRLQLAELELLYESGLAISQLTNRKLIAERIIELLDSKMDWHHTAIRYYDPQEARFELLAFHQPGLQTEEEKRQVAERFNQTVTRPGQGLSGWAMEHHQIVRSGDLAHDSRYVDTFPGLQSGLYVPLMVGERAVGVISIESENADAFSEADERLTATLAAQAASALENARLFLETRQRAEEFAALYHTSTALSNEQNLSTLLQNVVERAVNLLGTSGGGLYLFDPLSEELEVVVATDITMQLGARLKPGQGLAGRVVQTHLPQRVDDYSTWEGRSRQFDKIPLRAVLEVPMLYLGELLGVLVVEELGNSTRKFTDADERLLALFAAQTAGAIRNTRLLEETRRRAEEFESLYETTRDLSTLKDLPAILNTVTQRAATLLGVANVSLNLYDAAHRELVLAASIGPDRPIGSRRPLGDGLSGRVAQTGAPLIVEDYQQWEHRSRFFDEIPLAAIMGVPLIYRNKVLGVLDVSELAPSKRTFGEADVRILTLFAAQAASAIANRRLYEETVHSLENLKALHTIDEAIAGSMDIHFVLKVILDQVISQLSVDAAAVLLFDAQEQELKYVSGQGFRTEALQYTSLALGDGYAGKAAAGRQLVYIPDLRNRNTDFLRSPKFSKEGFVSYFAVPLIAKGEVQGVLEILHRSLLDPTPDWMQFLDSLSKQAAIAIDNAALYKNLQVSNIELSLAYDATIEGWSHALDLRDKETEGHTQRVTQMTMELAAHMNIDTKQLLHIRRGALLHDIGKMGVPDQILLKPGALTDEEWLVMKQHPLHAYDMLKPIQFLAPALDIPYSHHEKWDGTGYPRGLRAEQIPLAARIFAVVDVWDALTSDRPYRPAWTKDKALSHIHSLAGTHFDAQVVRAFMRLFAATVKLR